jgi:hypothetical protein
LAQQEDKLSDEDLVVIPLPTNNGTLTYAVARLVSEGPRAFAEAIVAVPDTTFAPPRRNRPVLLQPGATTARLAPAAELVSVRGNDHAAATELSRNRC